MKTIKLNLLALLGLMVVTACNQDIEDFDTVSEIHDEAGMMISISSNSAILGTPESGVDLEDALVEVNAAYINISMTITSGNMNNIDKVDIMKTFNGGSEAVLATLTSLPHTVNITSLDDILSGTGVTEDDLRIGDTFTFKVRITQKDGDVYYYGNAINVPVNCLSDLAGLYTNPAMPACNGSNPVTVTEDSPGRYYVSSMSGYRFVPDICIGYYMVDVCGNLTYDGGDLEDNGYTGTGGTGIVNGDGSFTFTCFLNEVGYSETSTYSPL